MKIVQCFIQADGLRRGIATVCSAFVFGAILSSTAYSATYYVSTTGNNANNGLSWAAAKRTVQAALNSATHGDEIRVAQGTYNERLTINRNVALKGGYLGSGGDPDSRDSSAFPTIIDGGQLGSVIRFLINPDARMLIEGFVIQNGNSVYGGGIFGSGGSPIIRNNVIRDNIATSDDDFYVEGYGGAIYFYDGSPRIERNHFENNEVSYSGDAYASLAGGAIYCYEGDPVIASNTFVNNRALYFGVGEQASGAAVYLYTGGANAKIINNLFARNFADGDGAGVYVYEGQLVVYNNTFVDNDSYGNGTAISTYECELAIVNNIFAFNRTGVYSFTGAGFADYNCIYLNGFYDYDGISGGTNDIAENPLFVDVSNGDYHLSANSPCIDAGDNSVVLANWIDMDGEARISGGIVDIGADETEPGLIGDVNGDGCVNDSDLLAVLFAFGQIGGVEDLDGNGIVGDGDLLLVLFNFGNGC